MSHRRPDPRQAGLESALRNALRLAADSVDPAADGLDRIRAKISTRQSAKPGWATASPDGFLGSLWRWLEPVVVWLRYMAGVVEERFRPDPNLAGRLGWLRPAAAVATGVFVVLAASLAITALPAAITPANDSGGIQNSGGPGHPAASSRSQGTQSSSGTGVGVVNPSSHASRSCRASSAKPNPSGSPKPSPSSTTPTPTPTSSSPTTTPTPTPTSPSPSPSDSPSTSGSTTSPGASAAHPAATGSHISPPLARSSPTRHAPRSGCR